MWVDAATRPGATRVSPEEEERSSHSRHKRSGKGVAPSRRRVHFGGYVFGSVATRRADAGVDIINDVSGGSRDPAMLPTVADMKAVAVHASPLHVRGDPSGTQTLRTPRTKVTCAMRWAMDSSVNGASMHSTRHRTVATWIDPGIGFAKTSRANVEARARMVTAGTKPFSAVGRRCENAPMLVGASREAFLGRAFWKVGGGCSATRPLHPALFRCSRARRRTSSGCITSSTQRALRRYRTPCGECRVSL